MHTIKGGQVFPGFHFWLIRVDKDWQVTSLLQGITPFNSTYQVQGTKRIMWFILKAWLKVVLQQIK